MPWVPKLIKKEKSRFIVFFRLLVISRNPAVMSDDWFVCGQTMWLPTWEHFPCWTVNMLFKSIRIYIFGIVIFPPQKSENSKCNYDFHWTVWWREKSTSMTLLRDTSISIRLKKHLIRVKNYYIIYFFEYVGTCHSLITVFRSCAIPEVMETQ